MFPVQLRHKCCEHDTELLVSVESRQHLRTHSSNDLATDSCQGQATTNIQREGSQREDNFSINRLEKDNSPNHSVK